MITKYINRVKDTLPDTMSGLIRVALKDLNKVERQTKTYRVNMKLWHESNSHCAVCFAGSVIAKTLDISPKKRVSPYNFRLSLRGKLQALDYLRKGNIRGAAWYLYHYVKIRKYRDLSMTLSNRCIAGYSRCPEQFKKDLAKLANELEAKGL